ncbi:cupin domain-containing protein [Flavobacterium sp.]|uniref:cupin domain-containing protein n=1 Tax=Flavobacterium sp. TaxID=239 RepID=UPI002630BC39|nr:cupin domain-containing protein [Flavobacterium sp.]
MTTDNTGGTKQAIVLGPDEGRKYDMGFMKAVFKADEEETDCGYSVSEWWLEPESDGPGAHLHENNDEIFYVLEGKPSILIGEEWIETQRGSFIRIPAGTMHDFANKTDSRAGLLNFFIPGGFERNMPSIVKWFEDNQQ